MNIVRPLIFFLGCFFIVELASGQSQDHPWFNESLTFEKRSRSLVKAMTLQEKIAQSMDETPAIPRLGIPAYNWWNECLHGVARNGRATVFPQAIGLGATFDTDLVHRVANAISLEARAKYNVAQSIGNTRRYAGLTFWTPNVNIFRDPRWGRGQETYGEDPLLTSKIGVAFVKGLQGDHPKYLRSAACAKHYLVHSGPEEFRHEFDAVVNQKDLHETYLPAFEALVTEANVEGVMAAYNRVLGEAASGSKYFLTELLKEKWGFDGYVVSDCGAIEDMHRYHKVTPTPEASAALAIKSGLNLNCGSVFANLEEAINQGLLKEKELDESLYQLMLTRFRLGFFDKKGSQYLQDIGEEVVDSKEHRALSKEAALKSIVLLKNSNNLLPLDKKTESIYMVGPQATSEEILLGNYYGVSGSTATILDGIVSKVSAGTSINYKLGVLPYRNNVNPIDWSTGEAKKAKVMIAVMGISGLLEGEEGEALASAVKGDREDIRLPQNQIDYLKKLKKNTETPLVLILTGGAPIALPEVEKIADAILFTWYPGQEGGNAVGEILFGEQSPSGKLPVTFPYQIEDLPAFEDYNMKGRTYRYMTKEPQFPFGFGLTYGKIDYKGITSSIKDNSVTVSVQISNQGEYATEEVVQLYLSSPDAYANEDPISALKSFKRIAVKPGEKKKVTFQMTKNDFYQFSDKGEKVIRPGEYTVTVGGASPGKRSEALLNAPLLTTKINASKVF